jgi:hypothetical protein
VNSRNFTQLKEAVNMNDYDGPLIRMILEATNDPARMREIVYEVTRLTLRRQINLHKPPLSSGESKRKLVELDDAIARVESSILSADQPPERHDAATVADSGHSSSQQDRPVSDGRAQSGTNPVHQIAHVSLPIEELPCFLTRAAEQYDAPSQIEESRRAQTREAPHSDDSIPQRGRPHTSETRPPGHGGAVLEPPRAVIVANGEQWSMQQDNAAPHFGANPVRQIAHVSLPGEELSPTPTWTADEEMPPRTEQFRRAYPRQASDDSIPRLGRPPTPKAQAPKHEVRAREVVVVPKRVRHPKPFTHRTDLVISDKSYRLPPASRARTHLVISALAVSQLAIGVIAIAAFLMSLWTHGNIVQTNAERAPVALQTSTASLATVLPTPSPFPRPTVYGVYAIDENQLAALEQIQGTPVDPRTRSQLKITQPSRTVITGRKLKFVVYRRGLASSAPDNVKLRIAARIAHSMIFDSNGKPAITTPEIATWLIRNDNGYELQVSPVPDSAEMIELRPEDPNLLYPAGRYELILGEQAYDFVVAGEVLDPAHCVEGLATGRGPVFYECKLAQRPPPL